MYCKNCGNKLEEGQQVCLNCGSIVEEREQKNKTVQKEGKSKIAAGILGIFLGSFGVHNFYLGYTGKAVAQLAITLCTCGIFSFVSGIWGFIEGILILTGGISKDADGNPLVE